MQNHFLLRREEEAHSAEGSQGLSLEQWGLSKFLQMLAAVPVVFISPCIGPSSLRRTYTASVCGSLISSSHYPLDKQSGESM